MAELTLTGIKKVYDGKQVVHGLDVTIDNGEFVVIVGPSGCGKSTLLRMIAGLEDISQGRLTINGNVMNDIDPADRGCAMVFQNYALYPHMTVRENIAYPLKIARLAKAERERRVHEAATILDLVPYLDRRPSQLSGGQRQRVAMGRAIVREPTVFLFDEPLSNLDAKLRVQMRIEIRRLHKRLGATSIFVTHDQVEAMTLADKLVVMNGGHIEQIGAPAEVYRRPASTFVAGFLGAPAMNLLPATLVAPGQARLHTMGDALVRVPEPDFAPGTPFILGIRPEDVVPGTDVGGLPARIDLIEELGGSRIAYCRIGDEDVSVVLPRDGRETERDDIALHLPVRALHIFDAQTGRRREPEAGRAGDSIAAQ